MTKENNTQVESEVSVEKKLISLYNLQQIDSQIDKIKIIRGELPLEVEDLEDEIEGLGTRISNLQEEKSRFEHFIVEKESAVKESKSLIKKYEEQQMNVRNNREYDSLSKEVEFQNLEIQLAEKKTKEAKQQIENLITEINDTQEKMSYRQQDLEDKRAELSGIVSETEKEEKELIRLSKENEHFIEDRLLFAYKRIRKNFRNGLAVVKIERDACGGCFNKIPAQHQMDIKLHKKIIVCEYCGRILVDDEIVNHTKAE